MTRWSWVIQRFQAMMGASINSCLIVGCLLTISKATSQQILFLIQIQGLGGKGQCPDIALALPVGDQFGTMT